MGLKARRLRVELENGVPALPLHVCRELPWRREQQAWEELREAQPVLARRAEDGERAVEAEPVAGSERFEVVDETKKLDVVEHEPGVGALAEVDDEIPRRVEHALYLGDVVASDELFGRGPVELAE